MNKGQAGIAIVLVIILAVVVTVIVVATVFLSGPGTGSDTTYAPEDYGLGEYHPPGTSYDNHGAADFGIGEYNPPSSWCSPGETQSLEPLGVTGQLTINGMHTFEGQSLCKGTMTGTEGSAFLYANEDSSVWYITDEYGTIVLSYLNPNGDITPPQPITPLAPSTTPFSSTCTCHGNETTTESWCSPVTWGGISICGTVGGEYGLCKTIVTSEGRSVIGYEENIDGISKRVVYITDCAGNKLTSQEAIDFFKVG